MNYSRASFFLWGGFIGLAAFVMGRTTAPSGVSASSSNTGAGSAESNRQIAIAVKKEVEESMKNRMPKYVMQGIEDYQNKLSELHAAIWPSLRSTLQTARAQLELYKIQHAGRLPTFNDMRDWLALTGKSDASGHISENGEFGPYAAMPPSNPITGLTKVAASGSATKDAGWTYNEKTGEVRAVVTHAAIKAIGSKSDETGDALEFAPEN